MKLMSLTLRAALVCAALSLYCTVTETLYVNDGSGTETVGGFMVDTLGNPVPDAYVKLASDTGSQSYLARTDNNGFYRKEKVIVGAYFLEGYTEDSALLVFRSGILIDDDNVPDYFFLGIDTMRAPGSIRGRVLLENTAYAGVLIYIPGTSYDAHSDDTGGFVISNVPEGIYDVYFSRTGYIDQEEPGVTVLSGRTTDLPTKNLLLDPDGETPAPTMLKAVYDTASGVVSLWWNNVPVSDLFGYDVYRKINGSTANPEKIGYSFDSLYMDTVFTDPLDTHSYTYRYQVKSVDTLNNQSSFSPAAVVNTVSPRVLRTFFTWTLIPDTIINGHNVKLAVRFENATRMNLLLRWYTGNPMDTVRTAGVHTKAGHDTLQFAWPDSGLYTVCVEALDERGCVWRDSCHVSVGTLIPANIWEVFHPILHSRRFNSAAVISNTLFTAGGAEDLLIGLDWVPTALSSMESFTFGDSAWRSFGSMPSARFAAAAVAVAGKLFVIGGTKNDQEFGSIEIYNTQSNTWENPVPMPGIRFGHAACVIHDSIYIFGGIIKTGGEYRISSEVLAFDPATETFASKGSMSTVRAYHQAVAVNNDVYILGGMTDFSNAEAVSSVERYTPATTACTPVKGMQKARMHFGAACVSGKLYAIGGFVSMVTNEFIKEVEAYEPSADTWVERKSLPAPRHSFATCVHNSIIYIIGGSVKGYPNLGQTGTVFKYYP